MLEEGVGKGGCKEVEAEGGDEENGCEDEAWLDEAIWQRARAGLAIGAGPRRGSVNQPVAVSEERERRGEEVRLVGGKPREIPDPCTADPEAKQNEGQDATRRRRDGAKQAACPH